MCLDKITPVILTYNEAPNIGRCLEKLTWAKDIVILDSFSSDQTLDLVAKHPQARVFQRRFAGFADQCNWALRSTKITTEWVLFLDADYILSNHFVEEVRILQFEKDAAVGYAARFQYCIQGKVLRGAFYPPVTVLFLREGARFMQDGHAHRVQLCGNVLYLKSTIMHDDRKPFQRWMISQIKYANEEAVKIFSAGWKQLNWKDRIRKLIVFAPILVFFYGFFGKVLVLDGRYGLSYCVQRFIAEALLSIALVKIFFRVS